MILYIKNDNGGNTMYTWGYVKDAAFAYLDVDEHEALTRGWLRRFTFYANSVITEICSTIKPKHTFAEFNVVNKQELWDELRSKYQLYDSESLPITKPGSLSAEEQLFWNEYESYKFVNEVAKMPDDFVSFGDDVCTREWRDPPFYDTYMCECHDDDFAYEGFNQIVFFKPGRYSISYNSRWQIIQPNIRDDDVLDVPADIVECIPLYIASQCYEIDDGYKGSVYRNSYEMALARIDDTNYKQTKTFKIGGDW